MIRVGAVIIRIGFWGFLIIIIIVKYTPNPSPIIRAPILGFVFWCFCFEGFRVQRQRASCSRMRLLGQAF